MYHLQRVLWLRGGAVSMSSVFALDTWRIGMPIVMSGLLLSVPLAAFGLMTITRDVVAYQRDHVWPWWRRVLEDGPFWPSTRLPRLPYPPKNQ